MSEITYQILAEERWVDELVEMMKAFYAEVEADPNVSSEWFPATVRHFVNHPEQGRIIVFCDGAEPVGYSIVIHFWSNEYGGGVLLVDELFVQPAARGKGLARALFELLKRERPWNARMMVLEVARSRPLMQEFYRSVGFEEKGNALMTLRLEPELGKKKS